MYKRLFPLFNFFLFVFLFVLSIVRVQGGHGGFYRTFFKRIRFSDFSQQQQQHCHSDQNCDDDDAAYLVSFPNASLHSMALYLRGYI